MRCRLNALAFAFISLLALVSCSKSGLRHEKTIGFKVSGVETKAVPVTTANLASEYGAFTVDAYLTVTVPEQNTHYMSSVPVNYVSGKWTVDGTYYWLNEVPVDFFSYAPARTELGNNVMSEISYDKTASKFSFNYAMASDDVDLSKDIPTTFRPTVVDQKDIIVAYKRQTYGQGDVNVAFEHALAAVVLDASNIFEGENNDQVEIVVSGIKGIAGSGTCTVGSDGVKWSALSGNLTTYARYDRNSSSDYCYKSGTYAGQCFCIIPQTAAEGAVLALTGLFEDGTHPSYYESSINGQKYEAGKIYKYILKKSGVNWQWVLASISGSVVDYDYQEKTGI